jgi:hypothetical protein
MDFLNVTPTLFTRLRSKIAIKSNRVIQQLTFKACSKTSEGCFTRVLVLSKFKLGKFISARLSEKHKVSICLLSKCTQPPPAWAYLSTVEDL